jgi:hypothetical protein
MYATLVIHLWPISKSAVRTKEFGVTSAVSGKASITNTSEIATIIASNRRTRNSATCVRTVTQDTHKISTTAACKTVSRTPFASRPGKAHPILSKDGARPLVCWSQTLRE